MASVQSTARPAPTEGLGAPRRTTPAQQKKHTWGQGRWACPICLATPARRPLGQRKGAACLGLTGSRFPWPALLDSPGPCFWHSAALVVPAAAVIAKAGIKVCYTKEYNVFTVNIKSRGVF